MEIFPGIEIIDIALYIKKHSALIISDTQIGYEEALNKQGILIPRIHHEEIIDKLKPVMQKIRPRLVIINGDIKHEFSTISETEWTNTLKLVDFISSKSELILIRGNHDTILGPIAKKRRIIIKDYYVLNDIYICHGHILAKDKDFTSARTIIIGHEHPAVGLRDRGRLELYKCFLKGKYKDKRLIVLPSFNLLTEGTDILKERLLSPYLQQDISDFEVFVAGDTPLYFGKIRMIKNY
jgi:putative SbcD/Mre11-related phosphoesterase